MCGIAGFIASERVAAPALPILQRMTRALAHRGPDSEGYWQSADGRVNLGHRRLAIIDLTPTGHQPMLTPDACGVISYNGEIYNFPELRAELAGQGTRFVGSSDTEVLLLALTHWGVECTLRKLNGMFAFAYWNLRERKLVVARDRFGEKPLFYSWQKGTFLFGSELKALAAHPDFERMINRDILPTYLRYNYVPWPHSIFKNVHKLPPGHYLEADLSGQPGVARPYWRLHDLVEGRTMDPRSAADPALIDDLDRICTKAVGQRMLADVPLGAFLSGGIDSSTVVALMQKQSRRPVKTFTIGFAEANYDEAKDAARVAKHLGTEHHELYVDSRNSLDVIARLPDIYDEPFADSSQIPTTLVSMFTRRHVTVALSGDAGDELFTGYNRYAWSERMWPSLRRIPPGLRRLGRSLTRSLSAAGWDRLAAVVRPLLPGRLQVRGAGDKMYKLGDSIGAKDLDALYKSLVSQWQDPTRIMPDTEEAAMWVDHPEALPTGMNFVEKMMYLDQMTYLPSDILCKVDCATMSTGLESRVPFLDNEIVRFAWSLPTSVKLHGGVGKWPLRQLLKRYVPEAMYERPKTGFSIPIGDWLRGPLRDWGENMLNERVLRDGGFFAPEAVQKEWREHLSGRRNLQHSLWSVLMFQAWLKRWQPVG